MGRGLCQGSAEPFREWQVHRVCSPVRVGSPPGICALAVAFGSGPGGCVPGGDSGRLLGMPPLLICSAGTTAGSHRPLPGHHSAATTTACVGCSPPQMHVVTLPLLGRCVRVRASWGNNWQAAYHHEELQSCAAAQGVRSPRVPWNSQLLG